MPTDCPTTVSIMADQLPDVPSHIPGQAPGAAAVAAPAQDAILRSYLDHSSAQRINTDVYIQTVLKQVYPELDIVATPISSCNLLGFAAAGHASYTELGAGDPSLPPNVKVLNYLAPARRLDGAAGVLAQNIYFAKYLYKWKTHDFLLFIVDGRDSDYPIIVRNAYIMTTAGGPGTAAAHGLVLAAGAWTVELHEEIWVFDRGFWNKSRELYQSIVKASWDAVILDEDMKKSLVDDHLTFFGARETYEKLKVPWKRGIIYYGPPGNGKTISIKATMNMLYKLKDPVPTLYVRSLDSVSNLSSCFFGIEPLLTTISTPARPGPSRPSLSLPGRARRATLSSRTWTRSSRSRCGATSSTRSMASRATTASSLSAAPTTWTGSTPAFR